MATHVVDRPHRPRRADASSGARRFLYLIQEYEPFTFPMGSHAALADESYRFPHAALFSTELLRDYFRRARHRRLRRGERRRATGASLAFENAITAGRAAGRRASWPRGASAGCCSTPGPSRTPRATCSSSACSRSARAVERGAFAAGWTLHGIGTVGAARRLELGGGARAASCCRAPARTTTRALLREHDVGLALMYTPHPSLVPIEMAVGRDADRDQHVREQDGGGARGDLAQPDRRRAGVEAIADALCAAAAGAEDVERRARGSRVRWSRDWDESFDDALLDRVRRAAARRP